MMGQGDVRGLPIVHSGQLTVMDECGEARGRGNWPLPLVDGLAGQELYQPISRHDVKKKKKKKK